jgi:peptidoglycan/LPS O-acetylase OafA/YrhL
MATTRRQHRIVSLPVSPTHPAFLRRRGERLRQRRQYRRSEHGDAQSSAQPRIEALDGLRGISILIVLIGHSASTAGAPLLLAPFRQLGVLGVELFFAISGFIITLLLLRERRTTGTISLRRFWARRALRILPPFAAACVGIGLAGAAGLMKWWWTSLFGALTFTKDTNLFGGDWFFGHFWSLSLEEQFYVMWPLLLLGLSAGLGLRYALFGIMLTGPVLAQLCAVSLPQLQNILPFVPDLAAGCLFAILLQAPDGAFLRWYCGRVRRRLLLVLLPPLSLLVAGLRYSAVWPDFLIPLTAALLPWTLFVLVAETVLDDGLLRRGLQQANLRMIGTISYSVYLWQQLFLGPPQVYSTPWFWSAWPQNVIAALICGALAYRLVEKPVSRLKNRVAAERSGPAPAMA